jgi:hypothetical protein
MLIDTNMDSNEMIRLNMGVYIIIILIIYNDNKSLTKIIIIYIY